MPSARLHGEPELLYVNRQTNVRFNLRLRGWTALYTAVIMRRGGRWSFCRGTGMRDGAVETYHAGGLWHNRVLGERGVLDSHDSKRDAQWAGRRHASERSVEHVIRSLSGRVETVNTYQHESVRVSA